MINYQIPGNNSRDFFVPYFMRKYLFLIIAIIGTVLPLRSFGLFLQEHGFNVQELINQLFANHISAFFGWDVIISAIAVIGLVVLEGKRLQMKHLWIYILCNLSVGVSLALPLFLYAREAHLEKHNS